MGWLVWIQQDRTKCNCPLGARVSGIYTFEFSSAVRLGDNSRERVPWVWIAKWKSDCVTAEGRCTCQFRLDPRKRYLKVTSLDIMWRVLANGTVCWSSYEVGFRASLHLVMWSVVFPAYEKARIIPYDALVLDSGGWCDNIFAQSKNLQIHYKPYIVSCTVTRNKLPISLPSCVCVCVTSTLVIERLFIYIPLLLNLITQWA